MLHTAYSYYSGVPSVKPPNSNKRRESFSEMPPSAKPATPSITMETNTPRSPAVGSSWIKANPTLRKGELIIYIPFIVISFCARKSARKKTFAFK